MINISDRQQGILILAALLGVFITYITSRNTTEEKSKPIVLIIFTLMLTLLIDLYLNIVIYAIDLII